MLLFSLLFICVFFTSTISGYARIEDCREIRDTGGDFSCSKCNDRWYIYRGENKTFEFFGHWFDFIERIKSEGKIINRKIDTTNGWDNNAEGHGMIGSIKIRFDAPVDAELGPQKVTMYNPIGGEEIFYLFVLPRALIREASVNTLEGSFSQAIVTIKGEGLQNAQLDPIYHTAFSLDPNHPIVDGNGERLSYDSAERLPTITTHIVHSESTEVKALIEFDRPLNEATIKLTLKANLCDPLNAQNSGIVSVTLKAVPYPYNKPNYIQEIKFMIDDNSPQRDTFRVGEHFFARIIFKRPGRICFKPIKGNVLNLDTVGNLWKGHFGCDRFYWRMIQPNDFEGILPTIYDPNENNKVLIPAGDDKVDLHIFAPRNPAGCQPQVGFANDCRVWIQTWVGNTNTTTGDGYLKEVLYIRIPAIGGK